MACSLKASLIAGMTFNLSLLRTTKTKKPKALTLSLFINLSCKPNTAHAQLEWGSRYLCTIIYSNKNTHPRKLANNNAITGKTFNSK